MSFDERDKFVIETIVHYLAVERTTNLILKDQEKIDSLWIESRINMTEEQKQIMNYYLVKDTEWINSVMKDIEDKQEK